MKDRHNANILIDGEGHVLHIDFGYILGGTYCKLSGWLLLYGDVVRMEACTYGNHWKLQT